jgi:L-aminopeptidase/D-esterase-like protein
VPPDAGSLTDVAGVRVGHWEGDGTGVTVVLAPSGTVGSGEVRGGAPATREFALLDPERTVSRVDAVVLSGGSAFGLAAADGVVRFLAERGQGVPTQGGPVPIVVGLALFDLVASGGGRPGPDAGRAAAVAAATGEAAPTGRVGAGIAATLGKWRGAGCAVPGGLGAASVRVPVEPGGALVTVAALVAVNAVGDVVAEDGTVLAGAGPGGEAFPDPAHDGSTLGVEPTANTTLVVVATDARLDKLDCRRWSATGHHGLARSLRPSHTAYDGDAVVCLATGVVELPLAERIRPVVADVVAAAVRAAVAAG